MSWCMAQSSVVCDASLFVMCLTQSVIYCTRGRRTSQRTTYVPRTLWLVAEQVAWPGQKQRYRPQIFALFPTHSIRFQIIFVWWYQNDMLTDYSYYTAAKIAPAIVTDYIWTLLDGLVFVGLVTEKKDSYVRSLQQRTEARKISYLSVANLARPLITGLPEGASR